MIGKLKKPLIYLLAIMLVLPTWLAVGSKTATKAGASCMRPEITNTSVSDPVVNFDDIGKMEYIQFEYSKVMNIGITPIVEIEPAGAFELVHAEWVSLNSYKLNYRINTISQESPIEIRVSEATSWSGCEMDPATITGKLRVDTINPILTSVKIFSNNSNPSWAKVGDKVTLDMTASEAIRKPDIEIMGHDVTVIAIDPSKKNYKAEYTTTGSDSEVPAPIVFTISDLEDLAWNEILDVSSTTDLSSVTFDKTAPAVTVNPQTTDQKRPVLTGSIDDPTSSISVNISGKNYSATNNGDGTWTATVADDLLGNSVYEVLATATDLAGNVGNDSTSNELTINTVTMTAPVVTSEVNDKTIKLTWNSIQDAVKYHVYLKNKTNGEITLVDSSTPINSPVVEFQTNVAAYGEYYAVVTAEDSAGNFSAIPAAVDQMIIKVSAPAAPVSTTTSSSAKTTTASVSVAPQKAQAAVVNPPAPTTESTIETPSDDNGKIKSEETSSEEEDINWTPWIVLFVLILLAGAATGGYFYWFAGSEEDEEKPVVTEIKKSPKKAKSSQKSANRKAKRW